MNDHEKIEQQRAEKRRVAIDAGEMSPANRAPMGADPTVQAKLDRRLAKNALTSLGKLHPANVSRAQRRAAKIRGPLDPMHRDLKQRAQQRKTDGGEA